MQCPPLVGYTGQKWAAINYWHRCRNRLKSVPSSSPPRGVDIYLFISFIGIIDGVPIMWQMFTILRKFPTSVLNLRKCCGRLCEYYLYNTLLRYITCLYLFSVKFHRDSVHKAVFFFAQQPQNISDHMAVTPSYTYTDKHRHKHTFTHTHKHTHTDKHTSVKAMMM